MSRRLALPLALVLALGASCKKTSGDARPESSRPRDTGAASSNGEANPTTPAPARLAGDVERGRSLVAKYECSRCHDGTGLASAPFVKHCFECHRAIDQDKFEEHFKVPKDKIDEWKKTVAIYLNVPSFEKAGARYEPGFIQAFLQKPHKIRPNMVSSMPRLNLDAQQAADIAAYLTREAPPPGDSTLGDATAGRSVLEGKACGTCHTFSGVADLPQKPDHEHADHKGKDAIELAPDLRYTRERMTAASVMRWLRDPTAMKPDTLMPNLKLSDQEVKDAAAYILTTPLAPPVKKAIPKRLPPLDRKVTFEEVDQRVLHKTCRHCHTDPDIARGDGGPGMTGGFGFIPRKLNLSSYEGVATGLLDEKGERVSVFSLNKNGVPRLLAALLARQKEEAGEIDPEARGMPLGLPALSAEDVQIVESWIAQGRPK
jgi:cytochrome c2